MLNALAMIGHWEILIIVLVLVLLFGASKIPQLMRSMGSGISQFKQGLKEGQDDARKEEEARKKAEEAEKDKANPSDSGPAAS